MIVDISSKREPSELQTFTVLFPAEGFVMTVKACFYELQDSGCYAFFDVPASTVSMSKYKKSPLVPVMITSSNAGVVVFTGELPDIQKVSVRRARKAQEQKLAVRRKAAVEKQDKKRS